MNQTSGELHAGISYGKMWVPKWLRLCPPKISVSGSSCVRKLQLSPSPFSFGYFSWWATKHSELCVDCIIQKTFKIWPLPTSSSAVSSWWTLTWLLGTDLQRLACAGWTYVTLREHTFSAGEHTGWKGTAGSGIWLWFIYDHHWCAWSCPFGT